MKEGVLPLSSAIWFGESQSYQMALPKSGPRRNQGGLRASAPATGTSHTSGLPELQWPDLGVLSGCTPPCCGQVPPFSEHQLHPLE